MPCSSPESLDSELLRHRLKWRESISRRVTKSSLSAPGAFSEETCRVSSIALSLRKRTLVVLFVFALVWIMEDRSQVCLEGGFTHLNADHCFEATSKVRKVLLNRGKDHMRCIL